MIARKEIASTALNHDDSGCRRAGSILHTYMIYNYHLISTLLHGHQSSSNALNFKYEYNSMRMIMDDDDDDYDNSNYVKAQLHMHIHHINTALLYSAINL